VRYVKTRVEPVLPPVPDAGGATISVDVDQPEALYEDWGEPLRSRYVAEAETDRVVTFTSRGPLVMDSVDHAILHAKDNLTTEAELRGFSLIPESVQIEVEHTGDGVLELVVSARARVRPATR
jgi:hypothetical protein